MSIFELWLVTTLIPNINATAIGVMVLSGLAAVIPAGVLVGCWLDDDGEEFSHARLVRVVRALVITCAVSTTLVCILPAKKQMMLILGGAIVTNIEGIEKLPPNLVRAANAFLEGEGD